MNESIETQVTAIRIACTQLTAPRLKALQDSVEFARRVPAACAEAAAREMENHLRVLRYLQRLRASA